MHLKKVFNLWEDDLWLTSDTHYAHTNICKGVSSWPGGRGTRDFKTLSQMNDVIVNGINNNVSKNSHLIHGGDWSFGGSDKIIEFSERINCDNIYHVYGNHDDNIRRNHPINGVKPQELFTTNSDVLYFTIKRTPDSKKETIFLSHYAHLVWDRSHHGAMHLFGHSHASINEHCVGKSMDIGIDNAFLLLGEYRPFSIKEVLKILDAKKVQKLDHHNEETT
jgi:calcineurin-like phosphoesterase family protein